jgi:glucose/mannose-6-phosphate isomerase
MGQATLDDPEALRAGDPGGMLALVAALGTQLGEGFDVGRRASGLPSAEGLRSIAVCGMGGSGIVGDVVRAAWAARLPVPVVSVKGYQVPAFCGPDTLVLTVSYSGETEETLAAYGQSVEAGCRVVAICSGGQLADLARTDGVPHVVVPGQVPAPRAALGHLMGACAGVLDATGLIPDAGAELNGASGVLEQLSAELGPGRSTEGNRAKSLAAWLEGRTPVVWGSEGLAEAAALRWKTQLNENAKRPAFHAVLPELDHNEIEGWTEGAGDRFALVILRHSLEHPRIAKRVDATREAIAGSGLESREVSVAGESPMEILLSLVMLGDFVSTYLAILQGVDPMPVQVLSLLKQRLRA